MQLIEILEGLTPAELKKLEQELKEGPRKEAYSLFRELKKGIGGKQEFNRDKVFKKVLGETLTKDNDYKLRNETRTLKNILYRFLVNVQIEQDLNENQSLFDQYLVHALGARSITSYFMSESEKAIDQAKRDLSYDQLHQLLNARSVYLSKITYMQPKAEEAELFEENLEYIKRNTLHKIRNVEYNAILYRLRLARMNMNNTPNETTLLGKRAERIEFSEVEDEWSQFCDKRARWRIHDVMDEDPDRTAELIREGLAILEKKPNIIAVKNIEYRYTLLSLTWVSIRAFKPLEALKVLDKADDFMAAHDLPKVIAHYSARITALIMAGQFQKSIDFFMQYEQLIDKLSDVSFLVRIQTCYAYLLLGKNEQALDIIMAARDKGGPVKNIKTEALIRYVYIISALLDNEYKDALRNLDNLGRSVIYEQLPSSLGLTELNNFYRRYAQLKDQAKIDNHSALKSLLNELNRTDRVLEMDFPAYLWIKHQLKLELNFDK